MNLLQKLSDRFRRNQRVYVFFFCFFIAALFWLLLVLTKEYTSTVQVKVMYSDFPSGLIQANRLPEKFVINIKASGYNLISMNKDNELNIDVASLIEAKQGVQKISARVLIHDLAQQMGNDVSIISILPDSLEFALNYSTSVRLAVKPNLDVSFDRQYDSVSLHVSPDSVTATMPASYKGNIRNIETEKIKAQALRGSLKKKVKLFAPEGISLDTSEAEVFLEVEKFTEGTMQVPVYLVNVPSGFSVKIYPDVVTVKYLVSLSHYADIKPEMFHITVDASGAPSDTDEKLDVDVVGIPSGVRSVACQPLQVDFILKK
jgi:hypothetical protein